MTFAVVIPTERRSEWRNPFLIDNHSLAKRIDNETRWRVKKGFLGFVHSRELARFARNDKRESPKVKLTLCPDYPRGQIITFLL